jgi:hypothetical protein
LGKGHIAQCLVGEEPFDHRIEISGSDGIHSIFFN